MAEKDPTSRRDPSISSDALDKLLAAMSQVTGEVHDLGRAVGMLSTDTKITNHSVQELRKEHASLGGRVDSLAERVDELGERVDGHDHQIKRHDSGFRQTSEADAKHSSDQAALVIAIEDTRKLAKTALAEIGDLKREQKDALDETVAQTPVLAKVEQQTRGMSMPTKAAALINAAVLFVWIVLQVVKAWKSLP